MPLRRQSSLLTMLATGTGCCCQTPGHLTSGHVAASIEAIELVGGAGRVRSHVQPTMESVYTDSVKACGAFLSDRKGE